MAGWWRWIALGVLSWAAIGTSRTAFASADVRLGADFLGGIVEKLPPVAFEKPNQYRGTVHSFRLIGIDAPHRQILVNCRIDGAFRAPVNGPITDRIARSPRTPEGWRKFSFDIRARVNIEPSTSGAPRFRIGIEEVKRRGLDGASGLVARMLGQFFDDLMTQFADGRASQLSARLNAEIARHLAVFQEYGVFCGIVYSQSELLLHFDVTRLRGEGIVGYVFGEDRAGTVPLYRWVHPGDRGHYYTIRPNAPDRPKAVSEGIACYVLDHAVPGTIPLYHWSSARDHLYTTAPDGEHSERLGYRYRGAACYIFRDPMPGTVPLYRFVDARRRQHFYTLHPHAEFLK